VLRLLTEDRIVVLDSALRKANAIRALAERIGEGDEIPDMRSFLSALFQQESRMASRVEHGVTFPHHRGPSVSRPAIALGICSDGLRWGKREAAQIVFLIAWPERDHQGYLRAVAAIAGAMSREQVRQALLKPETPAEVLSALTSLKGS